ncbi:hypothetical protein HJFPF1_07858 [Paramyrothecium foliicola]|nr:hypothetical protein HJFPF1_07858 [Paramyrothecium foliicola]
MDLDIEMDDAAEGVHDPIVADLQDGDDILQPNEPEEPGEVADDEPKVDEADESSIIVPTKVHIRGVDTLHTDDIKAYVKAHYGVVDRVEWIDDTSANLLFSSELAARDALVGLSTIEVADATALAVGETLPAKPVDGKPEISLQVRFAVQSDRKQTGAALRSRYYLLHPEHDPEERRRRQQDTRSRYRNRDGDYRRNGGRHRRDSRDRDDEVETFEASMYDDVPRASRDRRESDSEDRRRSYAQENRGKELFADRASGRRDRDRGRERSASPMRDRDGDDAIEDAPSSSSRNRVKARSIRDRLSADNESKELFPTRGPKGRVSQLDRLESAIGSARLKEEDMPKIVATPEGPAGARGFSIRGSAGQRRDGETGFAIKGAAAGANARELFPSKLGGSNSGKELFEAGRSKRRQKAEDLFS